MKKTAIILTVLYFLASAAFTVWVAMAEPSEADSLPEYERMCDDNWDILSAAAEAIPYILDRDYHDRTVHKKSISSDEDIVNIKKLSKYAFEAKVNYLYTVVEQDGKLYFTSSNATKEELEKGDYIKYYQPYNAATKEIKEVSKKGRKTSWCHRRRDVSDIYDLYVFIPKKSPSGQRYLCCAEKTVIAQFPYMPDSIFYFGISTTAFSFIIMIILLIPTRKAKTDSTQNIPLGNERKKLMKLSRAGKQMAIGQMTRSIAHEINQPLCVIRGYLELLKFSLADSPEIKDKNLKEAFDLSLKGVDKITSILNHMRAFISTNNEKTPSCLKSITENALAFYSEQIQMHNIKLETEYNKNTPEIMVNPAQIEHAIVNIISNARYSVDKKESMIKQPFHKEIKISIYPENGKAVLEISDNGLGMDKGTLSRCTEAFFSQDKDEEGAGLGLTIAKENIKEAGGELKIKSIEGEGARFRIILPSA